MPVCIFYIHAKCFEVAALADNTYQSTMHVQRRGLAPPTDNLHLRIVISGHAHMPLLKPDQLTNLSLGYFFHFIENDSYTIWAYVK